jgi:hypothetical protein
MNYQNLTSIASNCGLAVGLGAGVAIAAAFVGGAVTVPFAAGLVLTGSIINQLHRSMSVFGGAEASMGTGGKSQTLLDSIGLFICRKLITRSQLAHPFRYSPLVYKGKPMIGGLPNNKTDGSMIQGISTWFKETMEVDTKLYTESLYDRFLNPDNWVNYTRGDVNSR